MGSAKTSNFKFLLCRIEDYNRKDLKKTGLKRYKACRDQAGRFEDIKS